MPIASANDRKPIPPAEAGVQHAVCVGVIDLGTQPQNNPAFKESRKVLVTWELPNQKIDMPAKVGSGTIAMPRVVSKEYTMSIGTKANLRKELESWRGRPFTPDELNSFELANLVGANCLLNIVHKQSSDGTRTYANVGGVMPLVKGMPKLAPENATLVYDLPASGPITFPAAMPEWIQNKIKLSHEYQESVNPTAKTKEQVSDEQLANRSGEDPDMVPF